MLISMLAWTNLCNIKYPFHWLSPSLLTDYHMFRNISWQLQYSVVKSHNIWLRDQLSLVLTNNINNCPCSHSLRLARSGQHGAAFGWQTGTLGQSLHKPQKLETCQCLRNQRLVSSRNSIDLSLIFCTLNSKSLSSPCDFLVPCSLTYPRQLPLAPATLNC